MLFPDAIELGSGVFGDLLLDVANVALIEIGWFAVLEDHEIEVFLIRETQSSQHFKR